MFRELGEYQVEIEMQNAEMRQAQEELNTLRARYFDLYDLAPVGYFTISKMGMILESNLTAATLLGMAKGELANQPISRFILKEDREICTRHSKNLFETGEPQRCELRMLRLDSPPFWARLEATAALDDDGQTPISRIVMSDITELKQAEDLRKVEENFRRYFDDSPLGNRIVTMQGETIYVNRAFLDLFGFDSIEELNATPAEKRYTIASLAEHQTRRDKRIRNENIPSEYEISILRKDGEIRHLKVFRKEVQWNGDLQSHVIYEDITDRKRTEEALLREKNIVDAILDSAPGMIYLYDDQTRLVRWNKKHETMTGYGSEELYGMNVLDWFKGDEKSLSSVSDGLKNTSETGFGEAEADLQRKDGTKIPMYFTACPLTMDGKPYFVGIGIDITERKRIDEERTLLSSVVEQAEDNVLITDERRTILYINPAFERSSGYCCEELKGQKLKKLRSEHHDEGFYHTTKKILDRGQVWMGVIINKGKNGTNFEIEGTISPIRNTSGEITHFVAVGRNMSRFRRLEKELQQAQKLDALGTLAGGIAHDFNNVLSAIMGFIEMEALDAGAGSQACHRMEQALSACCRARDLIKQILAFSRQSNSQRRPIEMGPILEDAIKMLRATIPTTIDIRFALQDGESVILCDPTQLHQVIVNLSTNAAHAMRDTGGILKISTDTVVFDDIKAAEHLDMRPGTYVRMVVGDTGHGMDRKTLDRIFEPFFTTKGPGEGAGIGLAVVHGIVRSHGGRIDAYSEPGKGSTFEIFFPVTEAAVTPVDKPKAGLSTGNERILLVDDEEMLVAVITDMLKTLGYEVVSANGSLDALQLFQAQCDRFHLVITDLTMPEMTGMELAAELLRIRGDVPIILSTGFTSSEIREKAMCMGIREVMMKPYVLHGTCRDRAKNSGRADLRYQTVISTLKGSQNNFAVDRYCAAKDQFIICQRKEGR